MSPTAPSDRLRLALPKGRVLPPLQAALRAIGLELAEDLETSRRLVVPVAEGRSGLGFDLEILLLKNQDVPIYVEHGVAEIGAAGTDLLYESGVSVFRPYTFPFASCRIVLAARQDQTLVELRRLPLLRVATKYVRYTRDHFARLGWPAEIIPLSGSVELAPVLGLADAIVDLSETGKTLRENGLGVLDVIGQSQLKLIGNRAMGRTTTRRVEQLVAALETLGPPAAAATPAPSSSNAAPAGS
jgi:ATP phosphoribosyltransferase